jgi:hypothetical protein
VLRSGPAKPQGHQRQLLTRKQFFSSDFSWISAVAEVRLTTEIYRWEKMMFSQISGLPK